jgi:F0F1-type ATP synthase membrane subunit b/b'
LATEDQRGKSDIHWLAPKIAEKIQERYAEIARLADEKRKALLDYDAKIEELESRIELIIKNGTDLII